MESTTTTVRIALLHPAAGSFDETESLSALNRIGADVDLLRAWDIETCVRQASGEAVDLVVLDRRSGPSVQQVLLHLAEGPPTVVVVPSDTSEAECLEAFRNGAADCVRHGTDYAEVLPLVALEQIRRWRQLRERTSTRDKVEWLERLNEAIVSELPVSLAVCDRSGRIVDINPEFSRAFGVSGRDALARSLDEVLPEDLIETAALGDLVGRDPHQMEALVRLGRSRDPEGKTRVFDVRTRPLDERGHVLMALSDVTRMDSLSRRLGEVERYNENIVQSINSALLVVDLEGRVTFSNSTAAEILGADQEDPTGRMASDWFAGVEGQASLIARTLQQGVRFRGQETMIQTESGVRIPVGVSCTPLLDEQGVVQGAVAIFQDLTEIKQLQRQVLQREKMASIGELAAGIAHEINNPVGFIHANLCQMTEYLPDLSRYMDAVDSLRQAAAGAQGAPSLQVALEEIEQLATELDVDYLRKDFGAAVRESLEGSERIRHIVTDLRDFSHRGTAERTSADVNQCVDTTANIVWTMMKHSVELEKEYNDLPDLLCYPMELKQVFMNLLMNAYQAIEEKLSQGEGTGVIRIETHRREAGIEILISDTGVGVAEADLSRIFDPFYTTKEVGAGTGLGLSTSYGIIKRHGGEISVDSQFGQGATFVVWLPFEPPAESLGATRR